MRQIILDTETTGLDPDQGHRIVEIGAIEIINYVPTDNVFHAYINPERDMPVEAYNVHGLSEDFLRDFPTFDHIADDFLKFVGASPLVIHNAPFDMKFINAELKRVGGDMLPFEQAIDTLVIARKKFPGSPNSLDALCRRFDVDTTSRHKHGALVDSELLAKVYLELVGGRQPNLGFALESAQNIPPPEPQDRTAPDLSLIKRTATESERQAHQIFVDTKLGDKAIWRRGATFQPTKD